MLKKHISSYSDEALMKLLSSRRSNEALTELHARYSHKVLGFFIRMFQGDTDKAQDFVQDLFLKILEKHYQFDPERKFYTWMFTIASNMCKTSFRDQANVRLSDQSYEINQLTSWNENNFDRDSFKRALQGAVERLEDHHRVTFVLRYMQEMSVKEVADVVGISEGTVKSRLFYATRKITKELDEFNPSGEGIQFKMS